MPPRCRTRSGECGAVDSALVLHPVRRRGCTSRPRGHKDRVQARARPGPVQWTPGRMSRRPGDGTTRPAATACCTSLGALVVVLAQFRPDPSLTDQLPPGTVIAVLRLRRRRRRRMPGRHRLPVATGRRPCRCGDLRTNHHRRGRNQLESHRHRSPRPGPGDARAGRRRPVPIFGNGQLCFRIVSRFPCLVMEMEPEVTVPETRCRFNSPRPAEYRRGASRVPPVQVPFYSESTTGP